MVEMRAKNVVFVVYTIHFFMIMFTSFIIKSLLNSVSNFYLTLANLYPIFFMIAVLSGKRCSEMTTCYDDIEAVTRLLQEKEKVRQATALKMSTKYLKKNYQNKIFVFKITSRLIECFSSIFFFLFFIDLSRT